MNERTVFFSTGFLEGNKLNLYIILSIVGFQGTGRVWEEVWR